MVHFGGTLNIRCRIRIGIQKRDHNFDNHPNEGAHSKGKHSLDGAFSATVHFKVIGARMFSPMLVQGKIHPNLKLYTLHRRPITYIPANCYSPLRPRRIAQQPTPGASSRESDTFLTEAVSK